jgi:hypothetical protein
MPTSTVSTPTTRRPPGALPLSAPGTDGRSAASAQGADRRATGRVAAAGARREEGTWGTARSCGSRTRTATARATTPHRGGRSSRRSAGAIASCSGRSDAHRSSRRTASRRGSRHESNDISRTGTARSAMVMTPQVPPSIPAGAPCPRRAGCCGVNGLGPSAALDGGVTVAGAGGVAACPVPGRGWSGTRRRMCHST